MSAAKKVGTGFTKVTRTKHRLRSHEDLKKFREDMAGRNPVVDFSAWLTLFEQELDAAADGLGVKRTFGLMRSDFQSPEWYLGKLTQLVEALKDDLTKGDADKVAARAVMLGSFRREWQLKNPADRYLASAIAMMKGSDNMAATKSANAEKWHQIAQEIEATVEDTGPWYGYPSRMAREILKRWPEGVKKPGDKSLRTFLGKKKTR